MFYFRKLFVVQRSGLLLAKIADLARVTSAQQSAVRSMLCHDNRSVVALACVSDQCQVDAVGQYGISRSLTVPSLKSEHLQVSD